jgi:hypothetical protein
LDARLKNLKYLVKWRGYGDHSWELAEEVNGLKKINEYHSKNSEKPKPLPED